MCYCTCYSLFYGHLISSIDLSVDFCTGSQFVLNTEALKLHFDI